MKDTSKFLVLFYLLTITTLHFSCAQEKPSNTSTINPEKNQIDLTIPINKPTKRLDYPSGIRSILHDSKGNYWFGSHQEGVCLFDGKTFTYFSACPKTYK